MLTGTLSAHIAHPRLRLNLTEHSVKILNIRFIQLASTRRRRGWQRDVRAAEAHKVRISSFEGRYVMIRAKVSERENLKWLEEYCNMPLRDVRTPSDSRKSVRRENRR